MSQKGMEANDISPETDQTDETQYSVQNVGVVDLQDDIHVCRRCNLEFDSIQKYLEHKIKHDNFRVKYMRSEVDRRMVMPKLIQKVTRKTFQGVSGGEPLPQEEEKENNESKKKGRKSRKRANEIHDQDLVITEKPVYSCEKCHKKFNREATLRRHIQYDHNEDDLDDDDDDINLDDDRDRDYKPTPIEIQEEEIKDQQYDEEAAEMDSLDQVIMAAEMMEKAEGSDMGAQTVSITTGSGQIIRAIISKDLTRNQTALRAAGAQQDEFLVTSPAKRQKLSEEEKAFRKFVCSVCGNKFKDANVLKAHMVTHSSTRQYVCTYEHCPYSFKTKGSLKRHLRRHTGERPYPCELCGRKFAESGALTRHLKSRTPCTSKSDNDLPRYGKKWTYTPNIPAVTMTKKVISKRNEEGSEQQNNIAEITADSMIQDVSEVTLPVDDSASKVQFSNMTSVVEALEETLQEEEAEEIYDIGHEDGIEIVIEGADDIISDDTIGQFVQTETDINGAIANVCRVCGEDFSSLEALKIHLRSHLADQTCRCWLCHFNTESREEFENHMYIHHHVQVKNSEPILDLMSLEPDIKDTLGENKDKDKNYSYKDAQIAVKQLLEISGESSVQQVAAMGNRPLYKCPICVRKFRGSNYLKLHMRNHIGLRPHKCMECDKSFITKDTLNKHLSSHAQDRNFKCGECGKLFKRLSHVREHLKIHSGLRPYPCTICGKKFKTNNAMKVHLRTHSDILPYECSYCHRRFREKGSVLRHTRMHTGEKPYECRYCGRCFAEHGTLNRHLKAKVSCTKQLQELRDQPETDTDLSVLAEFSSVVADTQQYMIPDGEVDSTQIQESFVQQDSLLQSDSELQLDHTNQDTEYVLVQEGDEEHIQNLEIVTNEEGESLIEGVQIAEEYYVISGADGTEMKLMDGKTGQVVAVVPVSAGDNDNEIQTITLTHDNELSTEMEEVAAETAVLLETVESNEGVVDGVVEKTEEMQDIEQTIENQE